MSAATRPVQDLDLDLDDPLDPPKVVAHALGVSTQTLANWRCTKRTVLPYVKLGTMVRYRRSAWKLFVAAAEARSTERAAG